MRSLSEHNATRLIASQTQSRVNTLRILFSRRFFSGEYFAPKNTKSTFRTNIYSLRLMPWINAVIQLLHRNRSALRQRRGCSPLRVDSKLAFTVTRNRSRSPIQRPLGFVAEHLFADQTK